MHIYCILYLYVCVFACLHIQSSHCASCIDRYLCFCPFVHVPIICNKHSEYHMLLILKILLDDCSSSQDISSALRAANMANTFYQVAPYSSEIDDTGGGTICKHCECRSSSCSCGAKVYIINETAFREHKLWRSKVLYFIPFFFLSVCVRAYSPPSLPPFPTDALVIINIVFALFLLQRSFGKMH